MIDDKFRNSFSLLNTIEKRNQISNELIVIGELIKAKKETLNLSSNFNIKNYKTTLDKQIYETEMLDFFYEDIYTIEK